MSKAPEGYSWRASSVEHLLGGTCPLLQRQVLSIQKWRFETVFPLKETLYLYIYWKRWKISLPLNKDPLSVKTASVCSSCLVFSLGLHTPLFLHFFSPSEKAGLCSSRTRQDMSAIPLLSTAVNSANETVNITNSSCAKFTMPNELFVTLGLLSLVENVVVVLAIISNRNLHSPMYYFICCLAVSDMLVSVSHLVETIVILMLEHGVVRITDHALRQMDYIFDMMICSSVVSSLSFLGAIAVDRYITIFYALRYHNIMTIRRAMIIIVSIWVASTISSIIFIVYHKKQAVIICLISFFLFMLILMVTLYIHMFALARHHAKSISAMHKRRTGSQSPSLKGAITLTILLGIFFLCWGPFFLHLTLIVTCPENLICKCVFDYFNLYLILIICNSVIDPIIYAFRSQELWKTLKEIALCSW